jgi:hypothetical protein
MGYDSTADQVLVIEAWHLKSGPGAKDGRRILAINGTELDYEPWVHDWYPFLQYRKQEGVQGFWGIGIAAELESVQGALNQKCLRLETALRMVGAAHVLVHSSSKVNFAQWDNESGSKIEYQGVRPEVYVPAEVVPQQLVDSIERDYHLAFELVGVPESQAQGGVPDNLESGKAQEVYLGVVDRRMQVAIHAYHDMFLQAADIVLEFGREIVEKYNPEFGAKATSKKGGLSKILLKEIDMTKDEYVLQKWPTNGLSDDPSRRMEQVTTLANAGWLSPDQAKRLLDYPDLEEENDLENASYDAVDRCISEMLNEGRYRGPVPYLNLQQAVRQVQLALIKGWADGRPEARLQLLRDWLEEAKSLPGAFPQPQPAQQQASAPGTPVPAAPAPGVTPMMSPNPQAPMAPQAA